MRTHGGYYNFVNSLYLTNHEDNQGLPRSAKRIELIRERHRRFILKKSEDIREFPIDGLEEDFSLEEEL